MNVLSKLFVDTRENILSVCLAVLHILRLDRIARLGSSVAKKLLRGKLWSIGSDAKAIEANGEEEDDGFDERLPLSPMSVDENGVVTYEAVYSRPLSSGRVDSDEVETFEAVASICDGSERAKTAELREPAITSIGGKTPTPSVVHELKFPGIYMGDLVESKSPWATSSRHLLGDGSVENSIEREEPRSATVEPEEEPAAEDSVARSEQRPMEMLEASSGLAIAMSDERTVHEKPHHAQEENGTPIPEEGDWHLKRKGVAPLPDDSSGVAVAVESPLKKRKEDQEAPQHEPLVETADEHPPIHRTHEIGDHLEASHAKEPCGSSAQSPTTSFSKLSSSPEAYAMSLISPSSSVLRTTVGTDLLSRHEDSSPWKPEEAQRKQRESVQTNDTEDADSDRHWEESEANDNSQDVGEQRDVKLPAFRSGDVGGLLRTASRAESEMSGTDAQSVASTSEDEPWNSEDEEIFNATPPFLGQRVSSAVYHTV